MDRLISEQAIVDVLSRGYWDKSLQLAKGDPCVIDAMIDWAIRQVKAIPSAEPKLEQFAKWVASEIFDDMWEYNKDAFAEIACRKLSKLGIVVRMGDEWMLVEPQERSEE